MMSRSIFQRHKVFFSTLIVIAIFCVLDLFLCGANDLKRQEVLSDGTTLALTENSSLSQRIIGGDQIIEQISFAIDSSELPEEAKLDVFLTEGNTDCVNGNVLQIDSFSGMKLRECRKLDISYSNLWLSYGKDYYINFGLSNAGGMSLHFDATYDDCEAYLYHNKDCYGCSLSYAAVLRKTNSMYFLWKILGLFGVMAIGFVLCCKKSFWGGICRATLFLNLVLFVVGVSNRLREINHIIGIVAGTFLLYVLFKLWNLKEWKTVFCESLYVKVLIWIALTIFWYLHDCKLFVAGWDEVYHWAMAAKDIYINDILPPSVKSSAACPAYPPLHPLFMWFMGKMHGSFSENVLHFAKHVMETNLFFGIVDVMTPKKRAQKALYYLSIILILLGLPLMFDSDTIYSSLNADMPLAFATGLFLVALYQFHMNRTTTRLLFACASAMNMCMIKDNGVIHFLAIMFALVFACILHWMMNRPAFDSKMLFRMFGSYACIGVSVYVIRTCWNRYVANSLAKKATELETIKKAVLPKVEQQVLDVAASPALQVSEPVKAAGVLERSGVSVERLLNYLTGKGEPYQYEIIGTNLKRFFIDPAYRFGGMKTVSPAIVLLLACVLVWFALRKNRKWAYVIETFIIVSMLCCLGMYHMLYTFVMTKQEALVLYSETRYLGCFCIGLCLLAFYIIFSELPVYEERRQLQVLIGMALFVTALSCGFVGVVTSMEPDETHKMYADSCDYTIAEIKKNVTENDKVYLLGLSNGHDIQYIRYHLTPTLSNEPQSGTRLSEFYTHMFMPDFDGAENFETTLQDYQYVCAVSVDDAFNERYGYLFDDGRAEPGNLYRVDYEGDAIQLAYVACCRR